MGELGPTKADCQRSKSPLNATTTKKSAGARTRTTHAIFDDQLLCSNCRKIDFTSWFITGSNVESSMPDPFCLQFPEHCPICKMLLQGHDKLESIVPIPFFNYAGWGSETIPGAGDSFILKPSINSYYSVWGQEDFVFCVPPGGASQGLFKPHAVEDTCDYETAQAWLYNCQQHHGPQCTVTQSTIDGLRVIDCYTMTVVKASAEMRWIALSYVWGKKIHPSEPGLSESAQDRSRLPDNIALTVKDAITVTQRLGYQYLWVDEFCINQKDESHRQSQISKMDQIYRAADLTLVAAAGNDKHFGLPGVSKERMIAKPIHVRGATIFAVKDPVTHIKGSRWYERAWTFQEGILSKRLLVFTDEQMSFYCQSAAWMEVLGGPRYILHTDIDWDKWPVQKSLFHDLKRFHDLKWQSFPREAELAVNRARILFMDTVSVYSCRTLTFDADALNAFSGVISHLGRSEPSIFSLSGLPYCCWEDNKPLESVECTIFTCLSWLHGPKRSPRRRSMHPSWTWAGWTGDAGFMNEELRMSDCVPFLRDLRFESSSGEVFKPSALPKSNHRSVLQSVLDSVNALHFQAPELPFTYQYYAGRHTYTFLHLDARSDFPPPPHIRDDLDQDGASKLWSCFALGATDTKFVYIFLFIVEWKDQVTAERIQGFMAYQRPEDREEFRTLMSDSKKRSVRLI